MEINKQAGYSVTLFVRFGVPRPVTEAHSVLGCVTWLKFTDINKNVVPPSSGWVMLEVLPELL